MVLLTVTLLAYLITAVLPILLAALLKYILTARLLLHDLIFVTFAFTLEFTFL